MKNFKEIREKYRSKFPPSLVAAAVKIALDMGGNMTGAYKKIEAMKRGLADDPIVKDALRQANESVEEKVQVGKGKTTIDIDYIGDPTLTKKLEKKYNVKIKTTGRTSADVTGEKKNIIAMLQGDAYLMDDDDIEDLYPQLSEGTMGIGIFSRDPSEKKKAYAGLHKLVQKIKGSTKVGSPEGKKFGKELDMKYISDDELADDFARPSNKNMTIKDLMKKHEKRLGIKFE